MPMCCARPCRRPLHDHLDRRGRGVAGVRLVLTAADIGHIGPLKCQAQAPQPDGSKHEMREQPVLCDGLVRFVGDAIAFVVADTAAQARDAAELIEVDWEMGEAVADTAAALEDGAPLVWPELGSNKAFLHRIGDAAACEEAFRRPPMSARSPSPTTA